MKFKFDKRLIIILILVIIEIVLCILYAKMKNNNSNDFSNMKADFSDINITETTNSTDEVTESESTGTIISTTAEVVSAVTENIELHTTYYLEECYVEEDDEVSSGENLLMYTNETYLTAPYDCIINTLNIPEEGEECNNNYIEISSTSLLALNLTVDESVVNELSLGQEAQITISAYEDKILTGYITSISNTANNGNFTVVVEFDNDGEVKLGMTAEVTIE